MKDEPISPPSGGGEDASDFFHEAVEEALRWRRDHHWNGDRAWERWYKAYRGEFEALSEKVSFEGTDPLIGATETFEDGEREVRVNLTNSACRDMKAFLYRNDPKILAEPEDNISVDNAEIATGAINYEWRLRKVNTQLDYALDDYVIAGHCVMKTAYRFELNDNAEVDEDGYVDYSDYVVDEAPYARRVSPFNFVFDRHGSDNNLATAMWCAEIFWRPTADVLNDPEYSAKARAKLEEAKHSSGGWDIEDARMLDDELGLDESHVDYTQLFEVWDKKNRMRYVYARGIKEPLLEDAWPYPYLKGFPYTKIDFVRIPDTPYGVGIPYLIQDQQVEVNSIRTKQFAYRRRLKHLLAVHSRAVEDLEDAEKKLNSDEVLETIFVKDADAISSIRLEGLQAADLQVEGIASNDIQEILGLGKLARLGDLPSRTSAQEVSAREDYLQDKLRDHVTDVERLVLSVADQMLRHIQAQFEGARMVKIVGPLGTLWKEYTREDIQGQFDLKLELSTAEQTEPAMERQQVLNFLKIVSTNEAWMQRVSQDELLRWVLDKFGIKEWRRFVDLSPVPPATGDTAGATPPQEASEPQGDPTTAQIMRDTRSPASDLLGALGGSVANV